MGEYHPYFDTTPDYLNIAAGAAGLGGTARKRCKMSSMRGQSVTSLLLSRGRKGMIRCCDHAHTTEQHNESQNVDLSSDAGPVSQKCCDIFFVRTHQDPPRNWVLPLKILKGHNSQTFP